MSVAPAETTLDRSTTHPRAVGTGHVPVRPRPRRPRPGVGPAAGPRRLRFAPPPAVRSRACQAEPAPAVVRTWHLTERGLALVLVVAAALLAASVVVVGLTALRVTSDGYRPGHSVVAPVAQP